MTWTDIAIVLAILAWPVFYYIGYRKGLDGVGEIIDDLHDALHKPDEDVR